MYFYKGADCVRDLEALGQGINKDQSLRLNININALRSFNAKETNRIIKRPMHYIAAFQEAAMEVIESFSPSPHPASFFRVI
jgi:DNA replicative helicase MCM subunit Mcm2 (Cdc46/Mcm family)